MYLMTKYFNGKNVNDFKLPKVCKTRLKMLRNSSNSVLKGQCHEIFDHFFGLKDSTWAPYEQAKTVSQTKIFDR